MSVNNSKSTKKKKKDIQTCQHLWFDREMITCDNAGFSQNTLAFMLKKAAEIFHSWQNVLTFDKKDTA